MIPALTIRPTVPGDRAAIEALYPEAFPDEDLLPVVRGLLEGGEALSLGAMAGDVLAGHGCFTPCTVEGNAGALSLLGPLAVAPAHQGQGLGSALVKAGLDRVRAAGAARVLVLGDPAYYARFGFRQERSITTPCPIPDDWAPAWQGLDLGSPDPAPVGVLQVPQAWRNPAYWAS